MRKKTAFRKWHDWRQAGGEEKANTFEETPAAAECPSPSVGEGNIPERVAAEQGDAEAQFRLGMRYDVGDGVEENPQEAVKWFIKAAEQGYAEAQCQLGICYEEGDGVKHDYQEAVKWYRKAAEQECHVALRKLSECYKFGIGVKENQRKALYWRQKALGLPKGVPPLMFLPR